ncbi:MAG: hypothetical protein FWH05_06415 [Oscillospiraceae bacterium]|nr:hypothetical protein [Oscillospiraceae bacterium]
MKKSSEFKIKLPSPQPTLTHFHKTFQQKITNPGNQKIVFTNKNAPSDKKLPFWSNSPDKIFNDKVWRKPTDENDKAAYWNN